MTDSTLWEILVPNHSNAREKYLLEYHKEWDKKVEEISGGLTILKTARGHWINPTGKKFEEEMIPVRIFCTEDNIDRIVDLTLEHYDQEAVLAYELSSNVKLKYRT